MSVLLVIPARYASTRYPGKALAGLTGATGVTKSLIQRSWEAAQAVSGMARVVVATDDARIRDVAEAFGAEVVMTSSSCENGTERCAEAHDALGARFDMVVNLQGDAPLTPPWFIEELVAGLDAHPTAEVATPVLRASGRALAGFHEDRRAGRVGVWVVRPDKAPNPDGTPREDKIAAIGVKLRRWVSFHGIAINVEPDLGDFSGIVPCGIRDHGVTSLVDLGLPVTMPDLDVALRRQFDAVFGATSPARGP